MAPGSSARATADLSAKSPLIHSTSASACGKRQLCPNARTSYPEEARRRQRLVPIKPPPPKTIADLRLIEVRRPTPRGASKASCLYPIGVCRPQPVKGVFQAPAGLDRTIINRLVSAKRLFTHGVDCGPEPRPRLCLEPARLTDVTVPAGEVAVNRGGTSI